MRFVQRRLDSPGQRDVILFQQNCIIEPETMVAAATRLHCILFQRPQSRSRFPRIPDARLRAHQLFHKAPRQRGNSAKMSEKIQHRSLAREDRPGVSLDLHDLRARFYKRSVIVREGDAYFRIQRAEDLLGEWQTRANERLSGEDFSPRRRPCRHHCRGRAGPRAGATAGSWVAEYVIRAYNLPGERAAPPPLPSNCPRAAARSSVKTANLSIAPRFA